METKQPFEVVVHRHAATVARVCRAVAGVNDADDAWSQTFLSAMRAYPDLPADAHHEAWLVRIAHRTCIDILRSRGRRAVPLGDLPDGRSTVGLPGDDHAELWEALAALPERQRHTVAYHYLIGLPYAQVADLLGGTPEAARRAAADGIAALRRTYPRQETS